MKKRAFLPKNGSIDSGWDKMPKYILSASNSEKDEEMGASSIMKAVEYIMRKDEFSNLSMRTLYHEDLRGAYIMIDLPLGVCQIYEVREAV